MAYEVYENTLRVKCTKCMTNLKAEAQYSPLIKTMHVMVEPCPICSKKVARRVVTRRKCY